MESFRAMILSDSKEFKRAFAMYKKQNAFALEGEMYKRNRHPDAPEHLHNWLDRKAISLMRTSSDWDLLYSDRLADTLAAEFKLIAPMYHLMIEADARARKKNA